MSSRLPASLLALLAALSSQWAAAEHSKLETVLVTATREARQLQDVAASVGVLGQDELEAVNPGHSAELLNRIPGVNIVQLGSSGEGAAAAIRQPVSYGPVYLYLENGVPTRSAGFFNHNALYEVNTALGNGVEVIKGPGSALYGSDAIGAVINSLVGQPPSQDRASVSVEAGEHDWLRAQLRTASVGDENSYTLSASLSHNGGWRDNTDSERQELVASWYRQLGERWTVNTVASGSVINMATGGSGLRYDDFRNDPQQAGNTIGFRDVKAFRLSSAFEKTTHKGLLSLTPYLRSNQLDYIATWTLNTGRVQPPPPWCPSCPAALDSQDAHINQSGHDSLGLLAKFRRDFAESSFYIAGVDIDVSRGDTRQDYIERSDNDPGNYWQSYRRAGRLYDFTVDFTSVSPYVHIEHQLSSRLRATAGLRYDAIRYDYRDHLSGPDTPLHLRPRDQAIDFEHLSPKLGLIYDINERLNAYLAYRHAFRIPSAGQLFRSGSTQDSTALEPVKADSIEVGLRGEWGHRGSFEISLYDMRKEDDILSIQDTGTGARRNTNAGETRHRGIELGVAQRLGSSLDVSVAYSRNQHEYRDWVDRSGDFSGNDMPDAPRSFANIRLNYHPLALKGGYLEVEWSHQGPHWLDEANGDDGNANDRDRYKGHALLNLRAEYPLSDTLSVYGRVLNVDDRRYAETTSKWGPSYTPGRPRTAILGVKVDW